MSSLLVWGAVPLLLFRRVLLPKGLPTALKVEPVVMIGIVPGMAQTAPQGDDYYLGGRTLMLIRLILRYLLELLQSNPIFVFFLVLGLGYLVGKIKIKGFEFGPVAGVLFVGRR
jgi:hypothetical protein